MHRFPNDDLPHPTRAMLAAHSARSLQAVAELEDRLSFDITNTVSKRLRKSIIAGVIIALIGTLGAGAINGYEISQNMTIQSRLTRDHANTSAVERNMDSQLAELHTAEAKNSAILKRIDTLANEIHEGN